MQDDTSGGDVAPQNIVWDSEKGKKALSGFLASHTQNRMLLVSTHEGLREVPDPILCQCNLCVAGRDALGLNAS